MQERNVSDIIETYLKSLLAQDQQVEIRRAAIAEQFNCVPSQINYVIKTRFTPERGYVVESKRGGGGYIRIERIALLDDETFLSQLRSSLPDRLSANDATAIVQRLYDAELLTRATANAALSMLSHYTLGVLLPQDEAVMRQRLIVALIDSIRYQR